MSVGCRWWGWRPPAFTGNQCIGCWKDWCGSKTDVNDAIWGASLIEHGLVRPSFIPPEPFRALRDLTRYRKALAEERSREVQRLHKVLEDAGVKLSSVASHVLTKSGRAMIDALIAGERDSVVLAEMAKGRLRAKIPQLQDALAGRFNEHHALIASAMLARIDQIDATIAALGDRIDELLNPYQAAVTLLVTIPGVSTPTAQVILAEIGADMSRFPTSGHLASWAGMCPGNNESAGKHKSGRTRKGSKWLRKALIEAGQAAGRTKNTYLAAQYHQIRRRRGPQRTAVAVGHSILVITWHLLTNGETYNDLGSDYFDKRRNSQARQRRLIAQLQALGHTLTLQPAAAQPTQQHLRAPPRTGATAPKTQRYNKPRETTDSHLSKALATRHPSVGSQRRLNRSYSTV